MRIVPIKLPFDLLLDKFWNGEIRLPQIAFDHLFPPLLNGSD